MANPAQETFLLFGPEQHPVNPAADCVEQFQPIFQGRMFLQLPLVVAFAAGIKNPAVTDMMGVNFQAVALFGASFPTDFGFSHDENRPPGRWPPPSPLFPLRAPQIPT